LGEACILDEGVPDGIPEQDGLREAPGPYFVPAIFRKHPNLMD
jgi:hypothetical protein